MAFSKLEIIDYVMDGTTDTNSAILGNMLDNFEGGESKTMTIIATPSEGANWGPDPNNENIVICTYDMSVSYEECVEAIANGIIPTCIIKYSSGDQLFGYLSEYFEPAWNYSTIRFSTFINKSKNYDPKLKQAEGGPSISGIIWHLEQDGPDTTSAVAKAYQVNYPN